MLEDKVALGTGGGTGLGQGDGRRAGALRGAGRHRRAPDRGARGCADELGGEVTNVHGEIRGHEGARAISGRCSVATNASTVWHPQRGGQDLGPRAVGPSSNVSSSPPRLGGHGAFECRARRRRGGFTHELAARLTGRGHHGRRRGPASRALRDRRFASTPGSWARPRRPPCPLAPLPSGRPRVAHGLAAGPHVQRHDGHP